MAKETFDVELYRYPRVNSVPTTHTIASSDSYLKALREVVDWLEQETYGGDATHVTERRNGWDIHYPDHTDTIDIVGYRSIDTELSNAERRALAEITPEWEVTSG